MGRPMNMWVLDRPVGLRMISVFFRWPVTRDPSGSTNWPVLISNNTDLDQNDLAGNDTCQPRPCSLSLTYISQMKHFVWLIQKSRNGNGALSGPHLPMSPSSSHPQTRFPGDHRRRPPEDRPPVRRGCPCFLYWPLRTWCPPWRCHRHCCFE